MTYDIVIVGTGIAGLTAAIYGKRAGKNVLVLESHSYGGQIVTTPKIENYPATPGISGFDFATKIYEQDINLGTSIKFEDLLSVINGSTKTVVTNQNRHFSHRFQKSLTRLTKRTKIFGTWRFVLCHM